ncbi:hypothetical protein NP493_157g00002 [Ridgeia piscesae]|uniref:Secreted protein n=1 Tax=Ridgeia piscesae TaxID=27915 RepID=A0AAD9P3U8_RIDPI|nr:hypothetical protein NP493_157g00002 [Ridgeia piscesae]
MMTKRLVMLLLVLIEVSGCFLLNINTRSWPPVETQLLQRRHVLLDVSPLPARSTHVPAGSTRHPSTASGLVTVCRQFRLSHARPERQPTTVEPTHSLPEVVPHPEVVPRPCRSARYTTLNPYQRD